MNKIIINIILIFSMLSMLTSCNTASSSSDQDVYHPLKVSSGRWSEIQSVNIYYYAHSAMLSQEETEAIIAVLKQNSTPEEIRRMDMMLQRFKHR